MARRRRKGEPVQPDLAGYIPCDGCPGDGVRRWNGRWLDGVWTGQAGRCFRCDGKGYQTTLDVERNEAHDKEKS
jgi:hypothetical protein